MNQILHKRALLLGMAALLLFIFSCIYVYLHYNDSNNNYTAYIYQQGMMVKQIDLSAVTEEYTLTYTTPEGGKNVILVEPGGISISEADCPDLLCVHQGVIRNDLLPITCLPHQLVIELRTRETNIDTITY